MNYSAFILIMASCIWSEKRRISVDGLRFSHVRQLAPSVIYRGNDCTGTGLPIRDMMFVVYVGYNALYVYHQ